MIYQLFGIKVRSSTSVCRADRIQEKRHEYQRMGLSQEPRFLCRWGAAGVDGASLQRSLAVLER
jgi:hypothetical protein